MAAPQHLNSPPSISAAATTGALQVQKARIMTKMKRLNCAFRSFLCILQDPTIGTGQRSGNF